VISLSIVDQSPMRRGGSAAEALRESVELARAAEGWGFRRFWLAEHHNANSWAGTSPEILAAHVAAHTRSIRVGTGGIMLANYSALKVAEQFRVLGALFPHRIDLGIGRGAGADAWVAQALSAQPPADAPRFARKVKDLLALLRGAAGPGAGSDRVGDVGGAAAGGVDTQRGGSAAGAGRGVAGGGAAAGRGGAESLRAGPGEVPVGLPEVWLLGSGATTARVAAALGLPLAYAEFLATDDRGAAVAALYRQEFRPSGLLARPLLSVAVEVMCAPTGDEARFLASSRNLDRVSDVYGLDGLLPPAEAAAYAVADGDRRFVAGTLRAAIDGDPETVRTALLDIGRRFATDDLTLVTNCYGFAERLRSFHLIAQAFDLAPPA
jgi:luciferase family oxidoreductase group 1